MGALGMLHFVPLDYRYAEQGLNKSKLRFRNGAFMPDPDPILVWIKLMNIRFQPIWEPKIHFHSSHHTFTW
jgi:hypothetical protein